MDPVRHTCVRRAAARPGRGGVRRRRPRRCSRGVAGEPYRARLITDSQCRCPVQLLTVRRWFRRGWKRGWGTALEGPTAARSDHRTFRRCRARAAISAHSAPLRQVGRDHVVLSVLDHLWWQHAALGQARRSRAAPRRAAGPWPGSRPSASACGGPPPWPDPPRRGSGHGGGVPVRWAATRTSRRPHCRVWRTCR